MRVRIRPYTTDDGPAVWEAIRESAAALAAWMPWWHPEYSADDARRWLEAQGPAFAHGTAYEFAIVSADGRYLGGCGLNQIDALNRRANLGYWVRTGATRQGVATAAVGLLRAWGFANTNLERLEVVVAAGNVASEGVAQKAGATREAVLRHRLLIGGVPRDATMFAFVRAPRAPSSGDPRETSSGDPRQAIGAVALVVQDYDEAIAFYTGCLRFTLAEDTDLGGGKRWVVVVPPGSAGTTLLLARAVTPHQASRIGDQTGGRVFLFLHTDDFWRDYRGMRARGVRFEGEPRREPYGTVAVFVDLYGNRWDLLERSAGPRAGG